MRITYTSPRNMRWITALLKHLFDGKDAGLESVINVLENHCIEKIKKAGGDIKLIEKVKYVAKKENKAK